MSLSGFVSMNLSLIWRKENLRWCSLVPVSFKSSSQSTVLPSTPLHVISTSACIWKHFILKLISKHLQEGSRKSEPLTAHPFQHWALILPNELTNRWLCQYLCTVAMLVLVGQSAVSSIESWSLEIIYPKCSLQNCDLRFFNNWHLLQKRACWFIFDCLNGTTCFPF